MVDETSHTMKDFESYLKWGQGTFSIFKTSKGYPKFRYLLSLPEENYTDIKKLHDLLKCGVLEKRANRWQLEIQNNHDLMDKVIPFFATCLYGSKREEYENFKKRLISYGNYPQHWVFYFEDENEPPE